MSKKILVTGGAVFIGSHLVNPEITFKEGIDELIEGVKPQVNKIKDSSERAIDKLREKGLLK